MVMGHLNRKLVGTRILTLFVNKYDLVHNAVQINILVQVLLHAQIARPTPTQVPAVGLRRRANATQALLGRMGARAVSVGQASTRPIRETPHAPIVAQASTLQPEVQHPATHVATVLQTPTHRKAAGLRQIVSATQATLDRTGARAQLVCQGSTRRLPVPRHAVNVQPGSTLLHQHKRLRQRAILLVLQERTL